MATKTFTSGIRDNYNRGTVADFLREKIQDGSRLSVVSAYFTIYAYDALKECLDRIDHLDFLFGEPSFINRSIPVRPRRRRSSSTPMGWSSPTTSSKSASPGNVPTGLSARSDIKTITPIQPPSRQDVSRRHGRRGGRHTGQFQFHRPRSRLGERNNNIELNLIVDGNRDRQELKHGSMSFGATPSWSRMSKQEVLQYLEQLYENNAPEFIYYKTLFHIFEKFLGDTGKTDADLGQTSLFDTDIWKALFDFQKDGVKGAINKILATTAASSPTASAWGKPTRPSPSSSTSS